MTSDEKPELRLPRPLGDGSFLEVSPSPALQAGSPERVVSFFRSIPLFSDLSPEQIVEVLRVCEIQTFRAGEILAREGDAADAMYIIERGEVAITKATLGGDDVRVAYLGDGSVVGEMALIMGSPRTATVEAIAETRVYRVPGRDFDALRRQRSVAAYKILGKLLVTLGNRRQRVLDRIVEIHANPQVYLDEFQRLTVDLAEQVGLAAGEGC
jgi:CRP-like cAMP-binding protein